MPEKSQSRGTLVVTCGLPGSGKTHFTRKLVEQFNAIVADQDDLVTAVHGGDYTRYNEGLIDLYHGLEDMILDTAIRKGHHLVVVDRCCPKVSTRSRFASKARAFGYRTILVFFDLEKPSDGDKVKRRVQSNPRGHTAKKWMEVIQGMKKNFELPSKAEPFDVITTPDAALTLLKMLVTEDLSKGSAASGSPQVAAQSSTGSPSPSETNPTGPGIEAATTPTLSLPQTGTSQQSDAVPQAVPGQRPSGLSRRSPGKPGLRKLTGSSSAPQASSESTAQGE